MMPKFALIALLVVGMPETAQAECLGVAIESQHGPVNLIGISVTGSESALTQVISSAATIGVRPNDIQGAPSERTVFITFVSPRIRSPDAVQFVTRVRGGEFGDVQVQTRTMGIETLPPDRCPRS